MADLTAYTITDVTADNDRVRCECRPRGTQRGLSEPRYTTRAHHVLEDAMLACPMRCQGTQPQVVARKHSLPAFGRKDE